MLIPSIIFITLIVAGLGFWFYNRRQVESLVNNIDDKQAIINALQTHVETVKPVQNTPNTKRRNGGNKNKKKKSNTPIPFNPAESEIIVDLRQEKKNRPKPRRKPKTQQ